MTGRLLAGVAAAIIGVLACCAGLAGAFLFGGGPASGCVLPGVSLPADGLPATDTWSSEQVTNAAIIVSVGATKGVPMQGWIIAVATAMQESSLVNLPGGDRDSVGLFQQRPSQGWGTPEQLHDPTYAAGKFYDTLLTVPGWQSMALTDAAQAVQHSATPGAYSTREQPATLLVNHLVAALWGSGASPSASANLTCRPGTGAASLPAGFTLPADTPPAVATAIAWALAQLGTPYSFGGDCTDPHSGQPAHQCDCSSLVQQAYAAAGVGLPRIAADQSRAGTPVAGADQIRPGDLLFIPGADGTAANPGHVGMALGEGLLVHAPGSGDTVKISSLAGWDIVAIRRVVG